MDAIRWQKIESLVQAALAIAAEDRAAWLADNCDGDESLRAEVTSLLAVEDESESFLRKPAVAKAASLLTENDVHSRIGEQIGYYKILNEIGRGGMGVVYLAAREDEQFRQRVAIKLVRRGLDTEDILRRFRNERQILASLNHAHIARLLDGGTTTDGLPYFVLEYVEGEPLDKYCDKHRLSTPERLQLFRRVCAAVQYAHQNLIVHRDLKPRNILVTAEGEPKLLDFGIAKLLDPDSSGQDDPHTATSLRLMTPDYASPEQVRGQHVTTATDVYSLGVVLYELLTGARPYKFKDSSPDELSRAICDSEPSKPSDAVATGGSQSADSANSSSNPQFTIRHPKLLRGDLDNIVLMALRKDPQRRYESVAEFSADIQRHLDGLPVLARKDTFRYRAGKFVQRNRVAVTAALLVFLTLLAGVTITVMEKRKADRRFNDGRQMANALLFEVDDEIQKGPTKARAMLVKRALEYLDSLAHEAGNESGLQLELAAGYLKVGDIQGKPYRPNLGDTAGAQVSYRKAQAILESLTAAEPANLEARRYLSLSYQNLGRVQQRDGDYRTALENERRAVAISEDLVTVDPRSAQYRSLLADNYLHFGEALYSDGRGATVADHHQAIEFFRKALAIHSTLAAEEPGKAEYRYAAGVDYEYVGIAFNRLGDMTGDAENHRAALENHRKELEINEALAASDPSNAAYRRIVADVYGEVGLSQLKLGMGAEALENLRHRQAIFESIRTSDPTNVEARRDVANSYYDLGQALAQVGDLSGGLAQERRRLAILQELNEAEPANAQNRGNLRNSYAASAEMLKKIGDYDAALETYQKALSLLESWARAEPDNVPIHRLLAIENANIARVHETAAVDRRLSTVRRQVGWRAALEWYQRSLAVWHQLSAQGPLNEADATSLAELSNDIAKCDLALSRH